MKGARKGQKSIAGMFDLIQELRNETGRHFDRVDVYDCHRIKVIYQTSETRAEFKKRTKKYLAW